MVTSRTPDVKAGLETGKKATAYLGDAPLVGEVPSMDQNVARGELDVAVVGVGDADNPCLAQLWGLHESYGGLWEQGAVFQGSLTKKKTSGLTL